MSTHTDVNSPDSSQSGRCDNFSHINRPIICTTSYSCKLLAISANKETMILPKRNVQKMHSDVKRMDGPYFQGFERFSVLFVFGPHRTWFQNSSFLRLCRNNSFCFRVNVWPSCGLSITMLFLSSNFAGVI